MQEFKPDMLEVLERYRRFWNHESLDRPLAHVSIPLKCWKGLPSGWFGRLCGYPGGPKAWEKMVGYWISAFQERKTLRDDWLPMINPFFGPPAIAAFLTPQLCDLEFVPTNHEGTAWARPLLDTWEKLDELHLDFDNEWFRKCITLTDYLVAKSRGRFAVGLTDTHSTGDMMAALRGTLRLIIDIYQNPTEVKRLADICTKAFLEILDICFERIPHLAEGTVMQPWPLWAPGEKSCTIQEDVVAYFSPALYREFLLPHDTQIANHMDTTMFHVDGVHRIIPEIAKIRRLNAIQFTDTPKWFLIRDASEAEIENLRKTKKVLVIRCRNLEEAKRAVDLFGADGLLLFLEANSIEEGNKLLKELTVYNRDSR
jgi:hypothetical protein